MGGGKKEEKKGKEKELKKEGGKENEKKKKIEIPIIRSHPLFNLSQCEGLDHLIKKPDKKDQTFQDETRAENLIKATQAKIKMANYDKACYIPSEDQILMPRKSQFKTQEDFYSTMFHELSHWTGHKSRLNRDMISKFGTKKYAFEELVAEISASFLCCHLGFRYSTRHSAYVKSWIRLLKKDKKAIFKASSKAQKATELILNLDKKSS